MSNLTDPRHWGPCGWVFLLATVMGYPDNPDYQQQLNYRQFMIYLQYVLPCIRCRTNYSRFLLEMPLDAYLGSRYQLLYWLTSLYNHTKTCQTPLTIQQFIDRFSQAK